MNRRTFITLIASGADTTAPTVTISSSESSPTTISVIPLTFTFSESVTGFVVGDITIGGTATGVLGGFAGSDAVYTATFTPSVPGTVTVDVGAGVCVDAAGNSNLAATQFSITSVGIYGNPNFDDTSIWIRNAGWAISGGKATSSGSDQMTQPNSSMNLVNGQSYKLIYTITDYTSGTLLPRIGNVFCTGRTAAGTYTESKVYDGFTNSGFFSSAFVGSIDNVYLFRNP